MQQLDARTADGGDDMDDVADDEGMSADAVAVGGADVAVDTSGGGSLLEDVAVRCTLVVVATLGRAEDSGGLMRARI